MRKILIFIGLILSLAVSGQMLLPGITASQSATSGVSLEAEYQAVLTAMTTDPDVTNQGYQNTLVKDLKDAGLWAKADAIYVTAVHTNGGGEAYINWVDPGTNNLSDPGTTAPTFTAYEGFTGDGTSDYLSTNYALSTDKVNASQNSLTVAVYQRLDLEATASYRVAIGSWGTYTIILSPFADVYTSDNIYGQLNSDNDWWADNAVGSNGFFAMVRRGAGETEAYINGNSVDTDTDASGGENNTDLYILAYNGNGIVQHFSNNQISFIFIGAALSDQEVADMNTAVEKYMDALGKGVE